MSAARKLEAVAPVAPAIEFITLDRAVELLCDTVSISTLRSWIATRKIRSYKPGRRVLLDAAELMSIVRNSERSALPSAKRT